MTAEPRPIVAETPRTTSGLWSGALALLEENGTLVMLLSVAVYAFVGRLPSSIAADSWMVLLAGREIVEHGLPRDDSLTVWAHGKPWIDQQWLAQVTFYGVQRLGGYRLVMLFHGALVIGAFGGACAIARRRGASALSVTWIGALGLMTYYPAAVIMRAQSFAYGLFVAVVALLFRDSRSRSNSVFLVLPLLVIWANLHGSVAVGAGLASLYGLMTLFAARRAPHDGWARGLTFLVAPWTCVLASPYATSLPTYYRTIVLDDRFRGYITEWAPTAWRLGTAPLFLLVVAGCWLLGRAHAGATRFELMAFLATSVLAFQAERNMPWVGLTGVLVLPALLDRVRKPPAEPRRVNRILASAALAGAVLIVVATATKSDAWFINRYPAPAANAAAATAGRNGRIFANEAYADWLVWTHPELAGRIAFDARFELLSVKQLNLVKDFRNHLGNWRRAANGYGTLVLSASEEEETAAELVRDHQAKLVASASGIIVLRRLAPK